MQLKHPYVYSFSMYPCLLFYLCSNPEGACPLKIKGSFKLPFCVLRVETGKKGKRKQKKQQNFVNNIMTVVKCRQMIILTSWC